MKSHVNASVAVMLLAVTTYGNAAIAQSDKTFIANGVDPSALYKGWRASAILASQLRSTDGRSFGQVRNIVVNDSGKIEALIAERAGIGLRSEFVVRVPWSLINKPPSNGVMTVDLTKSKPEDFNLFPARQKGDETFLITAVIGDYVRLQTGRGYGYVSDTVFSSDGVMSFVMVAREETGGGGLLGFPYPGRTGKWSPQLSYYGLPFITAGQADSAAIPIDENNFKTN